MQRGFTAAWTQRLDSRYKKVKSVHWVLSNYNFVLKTHCYTFFLLRIRNKNASFIQLVSRCIKLVVCNLLVRYVHRPIQHIPCHLRFRNTVMYVCVCVWLDIHDLDWVTVHVQNSVLPGMRQWIPSPSSRFQTGCCEATLPIPWVPGVKSVGVSSW